MWREFLSRDRVRSWGNKTACSEIDKFKRHRMKSWWRIYVTVKDRWYYTFKYFYALKNVLSSKQKTDTKIVTYAQSFPQIDLKAPHNCIKDRYWNTFSFFQNSYCLMILQTTKKHRYKTEILLFVLGMINIANCLPTNRIHINKTNEYKYYRMMQIITQRVCKSIAKKH